YAELKGNKVQFIDTPGLLDRPLEKRNAIERQAILALRHLAGLIIFVFDPTEACGYTLDEQHHLLRDIKQRFEKPIIAIANKADLKHGQHPTVDLHVSAQTKDGISELLERVSKAVEK
ncbi:50S ribosome-binding GTPase, partial [Candidatus Woesearchaeota archaeon]|nr:50S ribosome-binding GTPase [Candidatus Woesearchaeota archaeon]